MRKRERARGAGLCIVCCKDKARRSRTTCLRCAQSKLQRKARQRARNRQKSELQHIVQAHERAGDTARDYCLYEIAVQHYQDALKIEIISSPDRLRIGEKLISVFSFSGKPGEMNAVFDRILPEILCDPERAAKVAQLLLKKATQMWRDSKTRESLSVIQQAIQMAELAKNGYLEIDAHFKMVSHLIILGRYVEIPRYLQKIESFYKHYDIPVGRSYYASRAQMAVVSGKAEEVYLNYDRALAIAKKEGNAHNISTTWNSYSLGALSLGNTELAKSCEEQALLIARQSYILWLVPMNCLGYADILRRMNQHDMAHAYLLEALSYPGTTPSLQRQLAVIGIPVALQMNDEKILQQCALPLTLELAFQSGEAAGIGPIASAFSQLYIARGKRRKAQALLHRAVQVVQDIDLGWDLPLAIAAHGADADVPLARGLLEARCAFPNFKVAQAHLSLVDAFIARRKARIDIMQERATCAVEQFEALHWYAYADIARTLLPVRARVHEAHDIVPFAHIKTLTGRERQVAELALKGLTNRAISENLSMSVRTVESHMASIMERLDIRSRYQLADVLDEPSTWS